MSERERDDWVALDALDDDGRAEAVRADNVEPVLPEAALMLTVDCSRGKGAATVPGVSTTFPVVLGTESDDRIPRPAGLEPATASDRGGDCTLTTCALGARRPYSCTSLCAAMSDGSDVTLET
mmetsp:Transcript_56019/g.133468  ORF Transcript_56019/g.133468 Transcript_56019/m.133468 type:complete len:123 (-) Transcript_56019:751-1119(-)